MEPNLVAEGLKLMLVGMSVVFLFLILLMVMMTLLSKTVNRFQPAPSTPSAGPEKTGERMSSLKKAAAIAASIHHFGKGK